MGPMGQSQRSARPKRLRKSSTSPLLQVFPPPIKASRGDSQIVSFIVGSYLSQRTSQFGVSGHNRCATVSAAQVLSANLNDIYAEVPFW